VTRAWTLGQVGRYNVRIHGEPVSWPDGFRIIRHDPEFERQMEVAREVMRRRRAVLHELAK
jgi:hypothetical protein